MGVIEEMIKWVKINRSVPQMEETSDAYATCKKCRKFGTMECPNSFHCFAKDDKPYFEAKENK